MRRQKSYIDPSIKAAVLQRDKSTCRYCGDKKGPFQADHVYPEMKGGETSLENLVTACATCNRRKHSKVGMWPKPIGYFDGQSKPKTDMRSDLLVIVIGLMVISFSVALRTVLNIYPLNPTILEILGVLLVIIGACLQYQGNAE